MRKRDVEISEWRAREDRQKECESLFKTLRRFNNRLGGNG